jgi:hypothetical protein
LKGLKKLLGALRVSNTMMAGLLTGGLRKEECMGKRIVKIEGMLLIKMYEEHESRFDFNDSVIKRVEKMLGGAEYLYATPEGGSGPWNNRVVGDF